MVIYKCIFVREGVIKYVGLLFFWFVEILEGFSNRYKNNKNFFLFCDWIICLLEGRDVY